MLNFDPFQLNKIESRLENSRTWQRRYVVREGAPIRMRKLVFQCCGKSWRNMWGIFAMPRVLDRRTMRGGKLIRGFSVIQRSMGKHCSTLRNQESLKWIGANWRNNSQIRTVDTYVIPLQVRRDIPVVSLPTSIFSLASPSLAEVRRVIKKARNRSAPGPNGVPYLIWDARKCCICCTPSSRKHGIQAR